MEKLEEEKGKKYWEDVILKGEEKKKLITTLSVGEFMPGPSTPYLLFFWH